MNWNQVEGKWEQVKGRIKQRWAKLTDDDLGQLRGRREELIGKIRERYGDTEEATEREVDAAIASM
jgi:uncharacterized protein YjbJ (UPF0337 family)